MGLGGEKGLIQESVTDVMLQVMKLIAAAV